MVESGQSPSARKRQTQRDSLFLSAALSVPGIAHQIVTRVRNLSSGGMLVDGNELLTVGTPVATELRGIGAVSGTVAWVSPGRAGVTFDEAVDPRLARSVRVQSEGTPLFLKTAKLYGTRPGLKTGKRA